MKRLPKLKEPKTLSARVELSDFRVFEEKFSQYPYVSFQDLMCFTLNSFISGNIAVEGHTFVLRAK